MKKLLAIILTALLALSLTAPALAYVDEVDYMSVAFDIQKQTVPFKADGVINDGEYFKVDVKDTWISLSCASPDGDQVCLDTETPLYMSWDENNVYIAAYYKVEGDNYYCVNSSLWDQCCIQTAFCAVDNTGTDTLEMGFGRNSDDGSLFFTRWYDWLASGYEAEEGVNCKITYEDSILLYEISVPWEGINDEAGKAGNQFMFNFIWGMGNEAIGYIAKQESVKQIV